MMVVRCEDMCDISEGEEGNVDDILRLADEARVDRQEVVSALDEEVSPNVFIARGLL